MALVPSSPRSVGNMAKRQAAKDQDKFIVRLPEGMRERIKAKADRAGWSMNEAVVWCLEQYFPAPQTLDEKLNELIEKVAILKGDNTNAAVDHLIDQIDATLSEISEKSSYGPSEFREAVSARYERYIEEEQEDLRDKHENPFDDANYPDPDRPRTYGNWDPASPDYDPFATDPLPGSDEKNS